jgi:hypothetical protein
VFYKNLSIKHTLLWLSDRIARLMKYDEFRKTLKEAKIPVKTLALVLEMNPTSITNYRGKGVVPRHLAVMATLIKALQLNGHNSKEYLASYLHGKV